VIRFLTILMAGLLMAPPLSAQDADTENDESADATQEAVAEPEPEEEPVDYDETGLDEQGFADEDDDFDPSEEIPTDQSIDFPVDI
jgi:hypothetical protein